MRLPFALARRFVAGETLSEALPVVRDLNRRGMPVALDMLGEYVSDRHVAEAAREAYISLVRTVSDEKIDANISIKLSMMGQKIDADFCLDNLQKLLTVAKERNVFVRLDMEGSDITQSTISLFEHVFPAFPEHVGIVLQAYLHRTDGDVQKMCDLGAKVRICKGAYKEPPQIAYQTMSEIRPRYIDYMKRLILQAGFPGIATHDPLLIEATKTFARENGIGAERFEFQMLYGIRPELQERIVKEGYNMRIYVPYGTEWVPYFSRRLRERKENVWFVAKNLLLK